MALAGLRATLVSARNFGRWDGYGIGSSDASLAGRRGVGYRQITGGALQVAWAAYGDTNLDGVVRSTDIIALNTARKFGTPATDAHWWQGDFNYDGKVNSTDITLLAAMFGKPSYYVVAAASQGMGVAEPGPAPKSLAQKTFAALSTRL